MTEFIIHADDFGINESVNACIDACFRAERLSEASLMVNMPACEAAVNKAVCSGYARVIGLHLNLSQGIPLTDSIKSCSRFCDANGVFNKVFHTSLMGRFVLSAQEIVAVREEIEAQMAKFCAYEGFMRRIDSHHHIHTDYSIYRIMKPLALQYGFTSMRIAADLHKVTLCKAVYKKMLNSDIRKRFLTTTHFDAVNEAVRIELDGSVEVMVHPLFNGGVLCDSCVPYADQFALLAAVPNAIIRHI